VPVAHCTHEMPFDPAYPVSHSQAVDAELSRAEIEFQVQLSQLTFPGPALYVSVTHYEHETPINPVYPASQAVNAEHPRAEFELWLQLSGVLAQALLQHVDQHMRHEDVVSRIMLAQLARTLTEWHCNSFTDLIDEMELWDWNVTNKDFWSRLAKSLHSPKVSITWAEKMDQNLALVLVSEKMSWATGNGNAVHPQVQDTD